ncbi:MAG: hypothetical protein M3157_00165 [Actinomycetota bacterium]|nr:hypothetical protein [Actinomycetota bacterium]
MSITRYYTIGAIAPDLGALKALDERLERRGVEGDAVLVFSRRRDEPVVRVTLPEARTAKVEASFTRMQWFEFASMFLGITATSVLMGAVHLWTGLVVEALLILGSIIGLILYHRHPRLEKKLLGMGLPEKLAEEWEAAFPSGFALVLVVVPEDLFDEAQETFLEDERLAAPLAVDRRPVF